MENTNYLAEIQAKLKAPKSQFNKFGNYPYRNQEDILEALKPLVNPDGYSITINDEVVLIGSRIYVKATATLTNGKETFSSTAFAREDETIKGMSVAQITGSTSSYARKYALNGLFAIDDTKDADATNQHGKEENTLVSMPVKKVEIKTPEVKAKVEVKKIEVNPVVKPALTEKMLSQAIARIEKGEADVLKKLNAAFEITSEQLKNINESLKPY